MLRQGSIAALDERCVAAGRGAVWLRWPPASLPTRMPPPLHSVRVNTYSLSKYASVIGQAGGWDWYQVGLRKQADTLQAPALWRMPGTPCFWRCAWGGACLRPARPLTTLSCATGLQTLLRTLSEVGKKHGVTIADVAARWVLDKPQVGWGGPAGMHRKVTGLIMEDLTPEVSQARGPGSNASRLAQRQQARPLGCAWAATHPGCACAWTPRPAGRWRA